MAVVYVHATRAPEFLTHYTDWCRSGFGRIDMLLPEGPPLGRKSNSSRYRRTFCSIYATSGSPSGSGRYRL